jgi:hypothetical protein
MNDWIVFEQIKTPENWKKKLLAHTVYCQDSNKMKYLLRSKKAAVCLAMLCITFLIGGSSALAYTLYGGDFFKLFFTQRAATEKEENYIDVEQLNAIASTTIGTVIDTDQLKIDVMDVLTSGNMMTLVLKVTAKQLDTVLYPTDMPPLQNYRFNNDLGGDIFDHMYCGSIEYIYSDKDTSLADNQFEIYYTLTAYDNIIKGDYTLQLSKFGYFTTETPQFHSLYDESWNITIRANNTVDNSKTIYVAKEVEANGYYFTFDSILLTPLTCSINYSYPSGGESTERFQAFSEGVENARIILTDGTILTKDDFEITWGSGSDGNGNYAPIYIVTFKLNVPINVDDIKAVETFQSVYEIG